MFGFLETKKYYGGMEPKYLTSTEFASRAGVSTQTVYVWVRTGVIDAAIRPRGRKKIYSILETELQKIYVKN